MRAIWKGAVSFGLVTVPVRLHSATENRDVRFHQVRESDGSRIRYKRVAEADGQEVAYADIAKGYDSGDGRTVIITDEDLAKVPKSSSKEISVEKFVPADQIDPLLFDKSYFLEPDAAAVKPYALLREALRDTDRMAVVTLSLRSRTSLAVLRVEGDVIVCQTLLWPDEVRQADFPALDDVPEPKESERSMAHMLIESMSGDFVPGDYEDDFRAAVEAVVEAKLAGGEVVAPTEEDEEPGEVVDLLAALQKSVERAKAARGEGGDATSAEKDTTDGETDGEEDEEEDDGSASGSSATTSSRTSGGRSGRSSGAKATSGSSSSSSGTSSARKKASSAKKPTGTSTTKKASTTTTSTRKASTKKAASKKASGSAAENTSDRGERPRAKAG